MSHLRRYSREENEDFCFTPSNTWLAARAIFTGGIATGLGYLTTDLYLKAQGAIEKLVPDFSFERFEHVFSKETFATVGYVTGTIAVGAVAALATAKFLGTFLKAKERITIDKDNTVIIEEYMGIRGNRTERTEYDVLIKAEVSRGPLESILGLGKVTVTSACVQDGDLSVEETDIPHQLYPYEVEQRIMRREPTLPVLKSRMRGRQ